MQSAARALTLGASDGTARDVTVPRPPNSVGVGSCGIDSHRVRRFVGTSTVTARTINERNLLQTPAGNRHFPVPAEYPTPPASEAMNLQVTFAASARHTGFGALRMEMAHMGSAEAAGIMAAPIAKPAIRPDMQTGIANHDASDLRPALIATGINARQAN
ncbi:FAD-dependent oxidoreductase [Methylobacterium currus]|uniref:FAD-dependent oxidoreductase n=1 Tax=Methylobacterium currus TaxID=2051553 RepID=A0A2R4WHB4_9HYPH|nr:FAD-dependent oxidoreductase [Methylobacterium currus]AWB20923.1 FAD-dependent oxidoreductase [Methylobacterium currus]UHC14238.1 FAD-dependent oxidoreductase [Methylobacterium currus]